MVNAYKATLTKPMLTLNTTISTHSYIDNSGQEAKHYIVNMIELFTFQLSQSLLHYSTFVIFFRIESTLSS